MTEDLLKRYYDMDRLDALLEELSFDVGAMLCASTHNLAQQNENWINEELVENMIESDRQLVRRFCDILIRTDDKASQHAGEKTRERYGI